MSQQAEQQPSSVHEKPAPVRRQTLSSGIPSSDSLTTAQYEPYVWHVIQGVIRDLQFLCSQGYLSRTALEEIVERLPRPVPATTPTPPHSKNSIDINSNASNTSDASQTSSAESPTQTGSSKKPPSETESPQIANQNSQIHSTEEGESSPSSSKKTKSLQLEDSREGLEQPVSSPTELSRPPSQYPVQPLQYLTDDDSKPPVPKRRSTEIIYMASASPVPDSASRATPTQQNHGRTDSASSSATSSSTATNPRNVSKDVGPYTRQNQQRQEIMFTSYSISIVEALWDFSGDDTDNDLSFRKGEIIEVTEHVNNDWWRGTNTASGKKGIFPRVYTRVLTTQLADNPLMGNYFSHVPQPQLHHSHSMTFQNGQTLPLIHHSNSTPILPAHKQQPLSGHQYSQQATAYASQPQQRVINVANGSPRQHTRNTSNGSTSFRAQHSNSPVQHSASVRDTPTVQAQTLSQHHQNIGSTA